MLQHPVVGSHAHHPKACACLVRIYSGVVDGLWYEPVLSMLDSPRVWCTETPCQLDAPGTGLALVCLCLLAGHHFSTMVS